MSNSSVVFETGALGFQMPVMDPFVAGMHHKDEFPAGNERMAPVAYRDDTAWGSDFDPHAPWRMYHGRTFSGFPVHPHRGFETVTVVTEGFADHADSNGSAGRYGEGDVQWMTAAAGCQHSEMFPLLNMDGPNRMELFQLWLNLAAKDKMSEPDYKMFWNENIPIVRENSRSGGPVSVKIIAGTFAGVSALTPPKPSWAHDPAHHVGIFLVELGKGARMSLPAVSATLNRAVYSYGTGRVELNGHALDGEHYAIVSGNDEIIIEAFSDDVRFLVLEGEPIGEPVAARGPFVMNRREELSQAVEDYRRTSFGGWPWDVDDPVHPRTSGRFAVYRDGHREEPDVFGAK